MAGTNAVAFKSALMSMLRTALVGPPQVRVDDAYNGKLAEREYVYMGTMAGPHEPLAFRNGGRLPRHEELIAHLHVDVMRPTATTIDTDLRIVAIGQIIEETIAADPTFGGTVAGLLGAWVSHFQLTSFYLDDGTAASEAIYQITVQSRLG